MTHLYDTTPPSASRAPSTIAWPNTERPSPVRSRVELCTVEAREYAGTLSLMPAPPKGAALPAAVRTLAAAGVDVIVSLLPDAEQRMLDLAHEPATVEACGLEFLSLPIPDFGAPDGPEMDVALGALAERLRGGDHVAIHCRGGIGRSSTVAAALLILLGVPTHRVWQRLRAARGVPVPETQAQVGWVLDLMGRVSQHETIDLAAIEDRSGRAG